MSMREYARKLGGEKAVETVDKSQRIQRELFEKFAAITEGATEGVTSDEEAQLIAVSMCEALSVSFANVVAATIKAMGQSRAEAVQLAIKSVCANINEAWDIMDQPSTMSAEQVVDLIKEAAANGGKPLSGEKD